MIFPWRAFIDNQLLPTQMIKPGRLEKIKRSNIFELIKSRKFGEMVELGLRLESVS